MFTLKLFEHRMYKKKKPKPKPNPPPLQEKNLTLFFELPSPLFAFYKKSLPYFLNPTHLPIAKQIEKKTPLPPHQKQKSKQTQKTTTKIKKLTKLAQLIDCT